MALIYLTYLKLKLIFSSPVSSAQQSVHEKSESESESWFSLPKWFQSGFYLKKLILI